MGDDCDGCIPVVVCQWVCSVERSDGKKTQWELICGVVAVGVVSSRVVICGCGVFGSGCCSMVSSWQWVLQQLGVGAGVFPAGVLKHGVFSVVAMEFSRPVWAWGVGSCSSLGVAEAWASSRGVGGLIRLDLFWCGWLGLLLS
ncbi:hypothetical protein LOK49_LG11G01102 [Camellia lanceoleosa]|uniref:Uncharacterized protein n=1 Tax=Camellia lanceoleosa TaxID=1840588 RepID=A0ACC0G3U6_9ERIC|nr:hypothetical protein LOK49_LG11G01102 [Camellia lanceoleosa]